MQGEHTIRNRITDLMLQRGQIRFEQRQIPVGSNIDEELTIWAMLQQIDGGIEQLQWVLTNPEPTFVVEVPALWQP
jgi:hypothetical protein